MNPKAEASKWDFLRPGHHFSLLPPRIHKEVRAILLSWILAWFAPCVVIAQGASDRATNETWLVWIACTLYAVSAAFLVASLFGMEFSCQTMRLLLSQPVSRAACMLRKLGWAALGLWTSALPVLFFARFLEDPDPATLLWPGTPATNPADHLAVDLGGAACNAFCLVPLFCLWTRNGLAGAVFSLIVPGLLWSLLVSTPWFLPSLAFLWGIGLMLGWQAFLRFEDVEPSAALTARLPRWLKPRASRWRIAASSPGWLASLIKKEIWLQRLALLLAIVFSAVLLISSASASTTQPRPLFLGFGIIVYLVIISLLIGALSCSEERELGTLEWQLTLPVRCRTQWLIKVTIALGLSLGLGVGLPLGLLQLPMLRDVSQEWRFTVSGSLWLSAWLTGLSLLVSSLCRTTLRAMLVSTALAAAFYVVQSGFSFTDGSFFGGPAHDSMPWSSWILRGSALALVLWVGFPNFRRVNRVASLFSLT
ncbi:MAG: ABC transporter permease subunit [Verrucomicrobiota bacterium]